jgi:hypothetical protein
MSANHKRIVNVCSSLSMEFRGEWALKNGSKTVPENLDLWMASRFLTRITLGFMGNILYYIITHIYCLQLNRLWDQLITGGDHFVACQCWHIPRCSGACTNFQSWLLWAIKVTIFPVVTSILSGGTPTSLNGSSYGRRVVVSFLWLKSRFLKPRCHHIGQLLCWWQPEIVQPRPLKQHECYHSIVTWILVVCLSNS